MKLHNVQQGSQEWHDLRARVKHTASDLSVIRGHSKYKNRTQAIRESATGIKPEVSEFQQQKFDEGHATEALARVIVEEMIGEELYPSVATTDDEYLLASSDGATMMGDTGYEHKLLNADVVAQIKAGKLDPMYTDQMDQQIAVYGFEKIIFVCSDGTKDNFHWLGYTGNPESIARIRADWDQFDADVINYEPEVIEAKPILTANPLENLPALVIEVTGRVTASNLVEFKAAATAVISSIKTELITDQDFVDATGAVKYLEDIEDSAKRAKQNALDQTASIADLHRALDEVAKLAGDVRKALDKKITDEKERRKEAIVRDGALALSKHTAALNERTGGYMPAIASDFGRAVKGLRTLDSMKDKVDTELARCKILANETADLIQYNIATLRGEGFDWAFLIPDIKAVCTKAKDDFTALLMSRVAAHKEAEEKRLATEREKIRAEEQAKAQAEQRRIAEAEQAERKDAEQVTAANQTQFEQNNPTEAITTGTAETPLAGNQEAAPQATIKLGEICTRLGYTVSAEFLASLGFEAKTEKNAKLYPVSMFPMICRRIADHTLSLAFKKAA